MTDDEKERILSNKLCLSCLSPGHRLNQCEAKSKCQVENCGMRHHKTVYEVDKRLIERAKAKKQEQVLAGERPASTS